MTFPISALRGDPRDVSSTALVTCLAILFYFFTSIQVSKARVAFGIKVPAVAGNPDFERVFRVQMNTLEWMPASNCSSSPRPERQSISAASACRLNSPIS
jgi:hypothetical protein